jgi:sarcosine oxidase subunit beta
MSSTNATAVLRGDRVVIIGGGVVGTSVAFHLAELGYRDVLVLERGMLGEGATAFATGGIRQQFTSPVNARLVHRSVQMFEEFEARTGAPFHFRQHGYLFLLRREEDVAAFAKAVRMQNELGIPTRLVDPGEIKEIFREVRTDDLLAGTYCATDGSATPQDAVNGYAAAARRLGAQIRQKTEVTGILRRASGEVAGVQTTDGFIDAEVVLIAAGPQARDVGRLAGVELPVAPHRRQAFAVAPMGWVNAAMPLTVDLTSGAYLHPEMSGGAVIGGNDRNVAEGTDVSVDMTLVESLIAALVHRFPAMEEATVSRGWAGLREMTPDDHALVGPVGDVAGLWSAVGFSGHGFMQAPAVGEAIAQMLVFGQSAIDMHPLRATRFAEGDEVREGVVF